MRRKTAIKKLMGFGASRNNARKYLDMMHKWPHATNNYAVTQYAYKMLLEKAMRVREIEPNIMDIKYPNKIYDAIIHND